MSDIHSNVLALKACVDYLEKQKCDEYLILGDFVSDAPYIRETMDYLYDFMDSHVCHVLRGNREEYMLGQWQDIKAGRMDKRWIKNSCSGNLLYTYEQLTEKDLSFFENLPISFVYEKEGFPNITCCHGSVDNSRELLQFDGENTREWLERIDTDYLLCGHTHHPGKLEMDGKHYFNSGSLGIAIEDVGMAQCMILESHICEGDVCWKPEFLRIPYDYKQVVRDIVNRGLLDYAPWFVNSNIYTWLTGNDVSYYIVVRALELAKETGAASDWPLVDEDCFTLAAKEYNVLDYRGADIT